MANSFRQPIQREHLPNIRGRYTPDAQLGRVSWFRTGGNAEVLCKPDDVEDLREFVMGCPHDVPVTILGVLSNAIIRDGGVSGVVIRLGREFANITPVGNDCLQVGAAALDVNVAEAAAAHGIADLEFLCGVPGSIGGALALNAGAYGSELKDVLVSANFIDTKGKTHNVTASDLNMGYRHSEIPQGWIGISAVIQGSSGDPDKIRAHMTDIRDQRARTQPIRSQTGGSTFKNPTPEDMAEVGLPETTKAWQLVDMVGARGLMVGGAQMSEQHANFMINTGTATSSDLEMLGEEVRRRVMDHCGYDLKWEIARIGNSDI
ncbi:MAG: UDP-N-acetylmuramate dehydrogenase [Alphaproteobacteria bacterium]|nr:UDP-N-acetylmuramate dehydrogenase [Alphaproteobacteria bacterium]